MSTGAVDVGGELERLRALVAAQGGMLASLLDGRPVAARADSPARLAASGPRAAGRREEYALLIEAIYEGYLLHYRSPRILVVPEADLGLLAGDQLYAIGLARLVMLGDTFAVGELADTITLSALAHGAAQPDLADAVWDAGAGAVGWGPSERHTRAKELLLAGSPDAIEAMRTSVSLRPAPA